MATKAILKELIRKMTCNGCDIDLDIEATFVIDKLDGSIQYELCGCCADKVEKFILKELP